MHNTGKSVGSEMINVNLSIASSVSELLYLPAVSVFVCQLSVVNLTYTWKIAVKDAWTNWSVEMLDERTDIKISIFN